MNLLLLVGVANDVFIYHMAKWLKTSIADINIDVYECYPSSKQGYSNEYYDHVYSPSDNALCKIYGLNMFLPDLHKGRELERFIRDKNYDIIQCHWIVAPTVLARNLKKHCHHLCYMFWGGEIESLKILFSHRYYLSQLKKSLKQVDYVVNSALFIEKFQKSFPNENVKFRVESLGSAAMDMLYKLKEKESKNQSKEYWNIPTNKRSILIGYSGKPLHNHLGVIESLQKNNSLKDKIHLLAPMTRGASDEYIMEVENALKSSGFSYTLLKNIFLTDIEIARLRNATDIVMQMSDFDGYSRSIIECMSASAILIYGDWLNYSNLLSKDGFEAHSVHSIDDAVALLGEVINNFDYYYKQTLINSQNGTKYLWSECIKGWVDFYKKLC